MTGAALGAGTDVDVHAEAPGDFVRFASELRFGTGAARYRRANLAEQLTRFADPRYVVARAAGGREAGPVVGGYAIDFRDASRAGARVPGAYRALLGVAPERRGEGVGRALAARARELIDERAATLGEPVLAWGCIDASNAGASRRARRAVRRPRPGARRRPPRRPRAAPRARAPRARRRAR